jgi:hypothetical protein
MEHAEPRSRHTVGCWFGTPGGGVVDEQAAMTAAVAREANARASVFMEMRASKRDTIGL